jgi:hypothetical protein
MSYEEQLKKEGLEILTKETKEKIGLFFSNCCLDEKKKEELIKIFSEIYFHGNK